MPRSNSEGAADATVSGKKETPLGELKFEAALAELEQIVQDMEGGRLPLEESLAAYRRGSELLKHCQQRLSDAERQIQILENGALRAFDADGADAPFQIDRCHALRSDGPAVQTHYPRWYRRPSPGVADKDARRQMNRCAAH